MNKTDVDYYESYKALDKHLLNEDIHGVMAWKANNRWTHYSDEHGCNPVQLMGTLLHGFEMDKRGREKISVMAGLLFSMLQDEKISDIIRAKMICDFSPRINPEIMRVFFDEGGSFYVDPSDLNDQEEFLNGAYIRAELDDSHMDGVTYALDKLCGWYAFDEAVMSRVMHTNRAEYLAAVVTHPHYHDLMKKKHFAAKREVLTNPDVLDFAIKNDKVGISDLGFMLNEVICKNRDDLIDEAIKVSIKRVHGFKDGFTKENFRAIELYIETHSVDTELRKKVISSMSLERKSLLETSIEP